MLQMQNEVAPQPVQTETPAPTEKKTLVIDPNAGASPTPVPTMPGIAIPGWGSMLLPAGKTEASVSLYNPEDNEGWYYLTFELRIKETGEVLFTTGLIPPGMYCNKVTLTRELEKGQYECIMFVQPYTIAEEPQPTNNAQANILIYVQ